MGRGRIGFAEGRGQELPLHYASDAATGTRAGVRPPISANLSCLH